MNKEFLFEEVKKNDEHIQILYDLLLKRDSSQNISHKEVPSFDAHKEFVLNNPYRAWFLVKDGGDYVGSFYLLDNNSIGLYLPHNLEIIDAALRFVKDNFQPLPPIKSVRPSGFIINIAIANTQLADIVRSLGGQAVQTTYVL